MQAQSRFLVLNLIGGTETLKQMRVAFFTSFEKLMMIPLSGDIIESISLAIDFHGYGNPPMGIIGVLLHMYSAKFILFSFAWKTNPQI